MFVIYKQREKHPILCSNHVFLMLEYVQSWGLWIFKVFSAALLLTFHKGVAKDNETLELLQHISLETVCPWSVSSR